MFMFACLMIIHSYALQTRGHCVSFVLAKQNTQTHTHTQHTAELNDESSANIPTPPPPPLVCHRIPKWKTYLLLWHTSTFFCIHFLPILFHLPPYCHVQNLSVQCNVFIIIHWFIIVKQTATNPTNTRALLEGLNTWVCFLLFFCLQ